MNNVVTLGIGAHDRMSVEQVINSAAGMDLSDVMILGYDKDNELVVRSSEMDRANALWMIEKAKLHALGIE